MSLSEGSTFPVFTKSVLNYHDFKSIQTNNIVNFYPFLASTPISVKQRNHFSPYGGESSTEQPAASRGRDAEWGTDMRQATGV
jgi:hypothetical protein